MSLRSTVINLFATLFLGVSISQAQMIPSGLYNVPFISGFNGNGTGWQVNSSGVAGAAVTADVLTLTTNGTNQARCAYMQTKQRFMNGFDAAFKYTPSGNKIADGIAFVIQNSASGTAALGTNGGGVGYGGTTASLAVLLNIYQTAGYKIGKLGGIGANNTITVDLKSGNPINVVASYRQPTQTLNLTFTDSVTATTSTATVPSIDLITLLGGRDGYIGFCGGTGGQVSTQTISKFSISTL